MSLKILKIGGSVCTEKSKNVARIKAGKVREIAREIKAAKKRGKFRLIIVHGAGPFGHSVVKKYGIEHGLRGKRHIEGFVKTHDSMEELNRKIVNELHSSGLLAFPIQTSAVIVQRDKKIKSFNTRAIEDLLKLDKRIVPVLYGDVVADEKLKGSVVSGDAIIAHLAKKMNASHVLFGTDVNGIFEGDPRRNRKAKHIPLITRKNFSTVLKTVSGSKALDVTGGMRGKLVEIRKGFRGTKVTIFDMRKKGSTQKTLLGKKIGTEIRL